jgi:hypothetical protein
MPRLYFVRMTYLAQTRIMRAQARRRARRDVSVCPTETPPVEPSRVESPAAVALADAIALAAAGKARLKVETVGVTFRGARSMQRLIDLRGPSADDQMPVVTVLVQGPERELTSSAGAR